MKKQKQNQSEKKLSLVKLQLSKINMANIHGGIGAGPLETQLADGGDDKCMFPEDASNPADHGIKTPTQ
ncbi:hypothetical protein [Chryseobacterium sp. SL1]|uniref:hypothetical protein n=1 Tax=Chryseobacterium sp. SL1 TaxID=2995159 RepID=UPI0022739EB6|nr:hypothetical protein [Chryseobacterium sp. SL1]MCY1661031.1 hypothetical protein [Chryseobacterium sp. SL1]